MGWNEGLEQLQQMLLLRGVQPAAGRRRGAEANVELCLVRGNTF